ncbi:Mediator of RNA polymerase II transcription subunit 10 [Mortierella sp. GBA30]|nr:Mediator of RNA polymerase II transcription subunit 10 [Mortierella sp. GBA30]
MVPPPPTGTPASSIPAPGQPSAQRTTPTTTQQTDLMDASAAQTEQTRQDLELKLQELIECLLELSITVYDFQTESNSLVYQKIQELITQLSDIEGFKDKLDMVVPWEVLSYIEDGKNPDLFSKTFVEAVAGENQFTNGKITALKASGGSTIYISFEAALTQNLGSTFPEEIADYEEILKETTSDSIGTTTSEGNHS